MRLRDLAVFSLLFATSAALGAHVPRAYAADPPPDVLDTLAHGKDGPEVARAAEALLKDYRSHPRASEAAELLAEYAYARGEYRTAAKHYETAIDLTRDPNLIARRRLWRSRALLAAGDLTGARHDLEAIGTRGPFADDAALGLADAAFLSGKTDRAIDLYQNFSTQNQSSPLRPIALGQLALVLERTGRSGQALELSRELVADYPAAHESAAARERIRRAAKAAQTEEEPPAAKPPATTKTPDRGGAANQSADDQAKGKAKAKEPEKTPPASEAKPAPPKASDRRLESGVEAGSGGRYSLQIGAFGDRENAADLARQLEQLGLPSVRVEEEMRGDRRFFRVRVGSSRPRHRRSRGAEAQDWARPRLSGGGELDPPAAMRTDSAAPPSASAKSSPAASRPGAEPTPMMRQYLAAKEAHPGALVFFRMGDFYELFFDDAVLAAEELGLTLTSRDKRTGIPMAGVPWHSAEGYIARLVRAGHRVAICDQVEDAKLAKGLVERRVTELVTPGTADRGERARGTRSQLPRARHSAGGAGRPLVRPRMGRSLHRRVPGSRVPTVAHRRRARRLSAANGLVPVGRAAATRRDAELGGIRRADLRAGTALRPGAHATRARRPLQVPRPSRASTPATRPARRWCRGRRVPRVPGGERQSPVCGTCQAPGSSTEARRQLDARHARPWRLSRRARRRARHLLGTSTRPDRDGRPPAAPWVARPLADPEAIGEA